MIGRDVSASCRALNSIRAELTRSVGVCPYQRTAARATWDGLRAASRANSTVPPAKCAGDAISRRARSSHSGAGFGPRVCRCSKLGSSIKNPSSTTRLRSGSDSLAAQCSKADDARDVRRSRRAMVCHYFVKGAVTYHDLAASAARPHLGTCLLRPQAD